MRYAAYSMNSGEKFRRPGTIFRVYGIYSRMKEAPWEKPCETDSCKKSSNDKMRYYIDHSGVWRRTHDAAHVAPTKITENYWIVRNDEWVFPEKNVHVRDIAFPEMKSLTTRIKRFART